MNDKKKSLARLARTVRWKNYAQGVAFSGPAAFSVLWMAIAVRSLVVEEDVPKPIGTAAQVVMVILVGGTFLLTSCLGGFVLSRREARKAFERHLFVSSELGTKDGVADAGAKLRRRADSTRGQANFLLVLLYAVIVTTVAIYVFAGAISGEDPVQTNIERMAKRLEDERETVADACEKQFVNRSALLDRLRQYLPELEHSDRLFMAGRQRNIFNELQHLEINDNELEEICSLLKYEWGRTADLLKRVDVALERSRERDRRFVSSIATRIGAILIMVFLAQFLIATYRYTIRLAAAYDAKADAIQMADSKTFRDPEQAKQFTAVDAIVFTSPKAPTEGVLGVAAHALGKTSPAKAD